MRGGDSGRQGTATWRRYGQDVLRLPLRLLTLALPAALLASVAQAATPPVAAVDPLLATAQVGRSAVQAATTVRPLHPDAQVATPDDITPEPPTPTPAPEPPPPPAPAAAAPAPAPAPVRVATPPPPPPAPPALPHSRLVSADGRLDTGVGVYSDCSGNAALTHATAAIDTCITGRTYFVGHNPGVFTPLMSETVGAVITWYDGAGAAHPLRIVAVRNWNRSDGVPPVASSAVVAQFQTCLVADGSRDVIMDAVTA